MPTYKVRVDGREYEVTVVEGVGGRAHVTVEGRMFAVEPASLPPRVSTAPVAPTPARPAAAPAPAKRGKASAPAAPAAARAGGGAAGAVQAPIPGVITKVLVKVGDTVEAGHVVVKLEAMKMENDIACDVGGTVKEVAVSEGAEVGGGQLLVLVE
jgi:glutaconyl-CoA/methylmalonyl-CoA decarboxylase subunit gamma